MSILRDPSPHCYAAARDRLLDAALSYHARGWCVIPTRGKRPACKWAPFQFARPTKDQLRELFSARGVDGLAVVTGPVSGGLACRDFDDLASYQAWADAHPLLSGKLPTVRTSRGFHVWFRGPVGFDNLGDGEYRADSGHYVLLPPSRHPSGKVYEWAVALPPGKLTTVDPARTGLRGRICQPAVSPIRAKPRPRQETLRDRKTPPLNRAIALLSGSGDPPSAASGNRKRGRVSACTDGIRHKGAVSRAVEGLAKVIGGEAAGRVARPLSAAIEQTVPDCTGLRNRKLFEYARRVRGIPELSGLDSAVLRPVVEAWHAIALPAIGTKPFPETFDDFKVAWERIEHPAGNSRVDEIFARVLKRRLPLRALKMYGGDGRRGERLVLLLQLCQELQRIAGEADFYLDCRTGGRLLGVSQVTAWEDLIRLSSDGWLILSEKGWPGRASRYRYVAGKIPRKAP